MKILHFIPCLSGGGAEQQLSYLAPELVRMGHIVHIAYVKNGPCKPELNGVILHQLKLRSNYDPLLFMQLNRLLHQIKPDVIHTWIPLMDIFGGIAARLNRIPWVIREASSIMAYPSTWKTCLRVWIASSASAIISNSSGGDRYWKTNIPNSHRYIVPNGLPIQEIDNSVVGSLPKYANTDTPIILYVGRLTSDASADKNLKYFMEVLANVRHKKNILGILCGEGSQRAELEEFRHKLGLDTDVYFTGQLPSDKVWALMKKASVFVSLSAFEGCPNTVMEAMVCECPLVLSDIPAHREILDEQSAIFVDPFDIQQSADAIIHTLSQNDDAKMRVLDAKGKTSLFSISNMVRNYEIIYKKVVFV